MRSIVRDVQLESAVSVLRLCTQYHPHFEDRLRIVGVATPLLQHTIAQEARCLAQDPGAADDDLIASGRRRLDDGILRRTRSPGHRGVSFQVRTLGSLAAVLFVES